MMVTRAQIHLCDIDDRRPPILRLRTDDGTLGLDIVEVRAAPFPRADISLGDL